MPLKKIVIVSFLFFVTIGFSQKKKTMNASMVSTAAYMRTIEPLAGKKLLPGKPREGKINPRRTDANKIVPGKGFPKGMDPLLVKQKSNQVVRAGKAPSLTFEVNSSDRAPSDPTGAIGPNHYVSAKNFEFAIHDRSGNELVASSSLANIFPGETLGDPIVFYDSFADRFVITQFSNTPNGFLVAVGQGPDPVNDGWFTYRFNTESFPDYTKFSIWSDGYYVTANKDQNSVQTSEIVFVIEREKMLQGAEEGNVKMLGFPLPGARIGGFYSPASFNALGKTLPPDGDARIIYFQDDEWEGVDQDILKLWKINVDWISPSQSTITEAEELTVTSFDSTFDGGSFGNLPQPGSDRNIDALQGAVMFASNYRRFCNYNSVLLNHVVDIDADADDVAGIRWYELRQNGDGQPWTVFQEGTYTSPDGKSAWCGSMAMDIYGNIGMGYTTMGTTSTGASADSFASIRYTGRLASDPLGTMTIAEQDIKIGTDIQREGDPQRYGDYAQLTVDPVDDQTFWHIAEYFENTGNNSRNVVGVFKVASTVTTDVGVVSIDAPGKDDTFTNSENITVMVKNFGSTAQNNIQVTYSINGGPVVNELLAGPVAPLETVSFSFATNTDLSTERVYTITAETNAAGDTNPENDCSEATLNNLFSVDVGAAELISPAPDSGVTVSEEAIVITLYNYGSTAQTNIPVFYTLNNGARVEEVFTGTLQPQTEVSYTFTTLADVTGTGTFQFQLGTALTADENAENDVITRTIERQFCRPTSDCSKFNDGVTYFRLSNVTNSDINCTIDSTGYEDFSNDFTINLNRSVGTFILTVQSGFANEEESERLSLWIDFNDNTVFEESELLLDNVVFKKENSNQDIILSLPNDAALGKHFLRVRAGDVGTNNGGILNDPCSSMDFGTTHDYTVDIGENKSIENEVLVIANPNNQFLITKEDAGLEKELRVYVFNVLGQIIASNLVRKDANDRFAYTIDMSYARSGIYFVRFGEKKKQYAAKFYVQ
ncbi:putative secreted protein (Por secretion system target) [Aquimarina sp. MAR_2010_214]|uniref:T9SS type A sorting domain-containing protein n=1 Tax=Aquimarina sp. MAR_2010_214 TaxID=1250026 RepID=UPI000C712400|nr:T9SS type A sorting domain-containing protein [Aquimarina sp. MAR_2010_214]PKV48491.1 putative secreted protein (Por secretion system target) [Aquimarina sp. MAR_2010_214]